MTTYVLSRTSPKNTILTDPEGTAVYEVSSTHHLGGSDTTIKRGDQTLATIHWKVFLRSTITWNGQTTKISEIFPRSRMLSVSRIYTTPSGERFKWKDKKRLYCVSVDTGLNLATYDRVHFRYFRDKKSTLDITSAGAPLADDLSLGLLRKRRQETGDVLIGTGAEGAEAEGAMAAESFRRHG